nr:GGDEF domain-containing protein [Rugamonas sp. CCM 8940]
MALLAAAGATLTLRTLRAPTPTPRSAHPQAAHPATLPDPDLTACRAVHGITAPAAADDSDAAAVAAGTAANGAVAAGRSAAGGADSQLTDPLTGSYHRREFDRLLDYMFLRARRYSAPLALVVFRLDQIRRINTMFGRASGDAVLADLARYSTERLRGGDVLARWDECSFALLLPGTSARQAAHVARLLQTGIEQAFFAGFGGMSCSVGISASGRCRSAAELARLAEDRVAVIS